MKEYKIIVEIREIEGYNDSIVFGLAGKTVFLKEVPEVLKGLGITLIAVSYTHLTLPTTPYV